MATILEAIAAGQIRTERGVAFDAAKPAGYYARADESTIVRLVAESAATYAGAVFVRFDEQIPALIPLGDGHAWAVQVIDEHDTPIGAIVTWTTEGIEGSRRSSLRAVEATRADLFHYARSNEGS